MQSDVNAMAKALCLSGTAIMTPMLMPALISVLIEGHSKNVV